MNSSNILVILKNLCYYKYNCSLLIPVLPGTVMERTVMSLLFAAICGIIQGAAEFLPVSSSGHLAVFQQLFMKDPSSADLLAFNVLLHLGTLSAALCVFRSEVFGLIPAFFTGGAKLIRGGFRAERLEPRERTAVMAFLGTLPMALAKLIDDRVELISSYAAAVGFILMINSVMLFIADRLPRGTKDGSDANPLSALAVGIAQCLAALPGLSRSGSSIAAGLACGYDRAFAVKFSFILSVPAVAGAAVFELPRAIGHGIARADIPACACGALTAFFCGIAAIKLLTLLSRKKGFGVFAAYSLAAGTVFVILGLSKARFPVF